MEKRLTALLLALAVSGCAGDDEKTAAEYLKAAPANAAADVPDYQLGKMHLAQGNYGLALADFTAALQREPGSVAALNGQAIAFAKMGRSDLAENLFSLALQRDPNSQMTLNNKAYFLIGQGDRNGAAELLARAKQMPAQTSLVLQVAQNNAARIAPPAEAPKGADVHLVISNGSGQIRLARRLREYLSARGYAAGRIVNAESFGRERSVLFCHPASRAPAEQIARVLPVAVKLVELPGASNALELIAGRDLNDFDQRMAAADTRARTR